LDKEVGSADLLVQKWVFVCCSTRIETNRYGQKYRIRATLRGVNEVELKIVTIWMMTETTTKFVTLVPDKGERK